MDETIKDDVRREIRRIRKERGLSGTALAARSGIDKATLSQIETGRRSPTIETLGKLAEALGVEVADLFPKVAPSLFDMEPDPQRWVTTRLFSGGGVLYGTKATEEVDWSKAERVSEATAAEMRRILADVEAGKRTADEAEPAITDAIIAMLKAGVAGPQPETG